MAKTVKSLRLSDAALAKLAAVAKQRGVSESSVVEQLLIGPDITASNDRASAAVAKRRLTVDPEKIAAFQRKSGMTVYDARKRSRG